MNAAVCIIETAIFVFERTYHQPHPNLSSHLVSQRLCSKAALSPGTWCTLVLHLGLNMVLRWRYVVLSMERSRNNYVINVCFLYNTYLLVTFWLLLHRKNNKAALWRTWRIIVSGQIVSSLLSLCMTKWLRKWRRGWRYVRSNTKNAKSLMFDYPLRPLFMTNTSTVILDWSTFDLMWKNS